MDSKLSRSGRRSYIPFPEFSGETDKNTHFLTGMKIRWGVSPSSFMLSCPIADGRIITNEKTGTIVAGTSVSISEVARAYGNLRSEIKAAPRVLLPEPFSRGSTGITGDSGLSDWTAVDKFGDIALFPEMQP